MLNRTGKETTIRAPRKCACNKAKKLLCGYHFEIRRIARKYPDLLIVNKKAATKDLQHFFSSLCMNPRKAADEAMAAMAGD